MEIWKPIKGYEGLYEVSSYGRIKSLRRWQNRKRGPFWKKEAILKPQFRKLLYLKIDLSKNDFVEQHDIHRLVAIHFIANKSKKPWVNHIDGNPSNNCVSNLEWCTPKENTHHWMITQNRIKLGENHSNSVLNNSDVVNIRMEYSTIKTPTRALAKRFGVSQYAIRCVINYTTWKHV